MRRSPSRDRLISDNKTTANVVVDTSSDSTTEMTSSSSTNNNTANTPSHNAKNTSGGIHLRHSNIATTTTTTQQSSGTSENNYDNSNNNDNSSEEKQNETTATTINSTSLSILGEIPPTTKQLSQHQIQEAVAIPKTLFGENGIFSPQGLWQVVMKRTALLVTLLLLQSLSQFILEVYEHLITYHVVVPLFLTMLVGAGGNAGNQATVRVIAGLVTGQLTIQDTWQVLKSEIAIGFINGLILAGIGFTRVYWMYEEGSGLIWSAIAITLSLFTIVVTSAVLGTLLPFLLEYLGIDREHAAPAIQVFMDICGVLITCVVCTMIIPDSEHGGTLHAHGVTTTTTTTISPASNNAQDVAAAAAVATAGGV